MAAGWGCSGASLYSTLTTTMLHSLIKINKTEMSEKRVPATIPPPWMKYTATAGGCDGAAAEFCGVGWPIPAAGCRDRQSTAPRGNVRINQHGLSCRCSRSCVEIQETPARGSPCAKDADAHELLVERDRCDRGHFVVALFLLPSLPSHFGSTDSLRPNTHAKKRKKKFICLW